MNQFKLLLTFCTIIWWNKSFSQSLQDFEYLGDRYADDELYLGVYPTYTIVSNSGVAREEAHKLKGWSGEIHMRKVNFERGRLRWNWQHKMIPDVILILNEALQKGNQGAIYRSESTAISNGVIGWIDWYVNLNQPTGKFLYGLGINHNDYFYGSTFEVDSVVDGSNWISPEPNGHYMATGPSFIVNYLPFNFLMIELASSYSFSYWRTVDLTYATNPDDNYPKPHWGQVDLELQTKWGFFTGFNYNWIINRGHIPARGKRMDLLLGFRFMI